MQNVCLAAVAYTLIVFYSVFRCYVQRRASRDVHFPSRIPWQMTSLKVLHCL